MNDRKAGSNVITTRDVCEIALLAAVIAIMAQIQIPMPLGVPMTMQTFAVTLAGVVLGSKKGGLATLVYVLLGAVGVPVFAGFAGGLQYLVGATGGFIISFPIMAFIIGLGVDKGVFKVRFMILLVLGTAINYVIGVVMFCVITGSDVLTGVSACVTPFIPTAVIKAVLATLLGFEIRKRLLKANLL